MTLAHRRLAPHTLVLAAILLLLAFAGSARAADIQVTSDSGDSGTCPSTTDCTLREAVEHANSGDVIHVPAFHINLGGVEIEKDVSITIVGAGAQSTIVDGNGESRIFDFDADDTSVNFTLRNLTVTNGNAIAADSLHNFQTNGSGGAIWNDSSLTLDHVAVTNSSARADGGGVGGPGELAIESSEVSHNTAGSGPGGGISQHNVEILNTTVSNNSITRFEGGGGGGGLYAANQLVAENNTIASNRITSAMVTSVKGLDRGTAGAGIGSINGDSREVLQNNVLADNLTDGTSDDCNQAVTSTGGNVSDDDTCGFGSSGQSHDKANTNPNLGPLALNGGQTQTRAIDKSSAAFDNAIDGTETFGPFGAQLAQAKCPPADQRDVTRPQFAACDSGAYELAPAPPAPAPVPVQQVAAQQVTVAGPTLHIAGAHAGCAAARTRIRVRLTAAGGVRSVKVTLGRKIIKRTKSTSFTLSIKRNKLKVGHNVLKVVVTDAQGRHVTRRAPLTRCRVHVAPHFTG